MTENVDKIRRRLGRELSMTASRLGELGWAVNSKDLEGQRGVEEAPGSHFDRTEATDTPELYFFSRERLVERLDQILRALDRLRDNAYGTCAECGEAIDEARLRVIPEATVCVRCQERIESVRATKTPRPTTSRLPSDGRPAVRGTNMRASDTSKA